jgi:hypothetical protein
LVIFVCLGAAVVFAPVTAAGFEIHGNVTNGTTGNPVGSIVVKVVDPRHGMATEEEIKTNASGSFVVKNLDDNISIYLLQVDYEGVTYTEMVRPDGAKHVDMQVNVYETTPDWDQIRVSIPHLMARRTDDTLSVDRIFVVVNQTDPPMTIAGEDAGFMLYLPEDRLKLTTLFVTSLGIPIAVHPHPTDTPGVYRVSYPFKPGETRVGASFDVAYADTQYTYREPLQYDIENAIIMVEDPTMTITSGTLELGSEGDLRGSKAYKLAALEKASVLEFTVRGGRSRMAPPESHQTGTAGHEIVQLDSPVMNASVIIIVGFVLLLVLVTVLASKSAVDATAADTHLVARRDDLLGQIAKLDDLFATDTVSDQLYKLKREELMDSLARIIFQIDKAGRPGSAHSTTTNQNKGAPHAG